VKANDYWGVNMDVKNDWTYSVISTPDSDYDIIEISFNNNEVAEIKRVNKELVIKWFKFEQEYNVPLDWLISVLQKARGTL
jgi:hypothetical protein